MSASDVIIYVLAALAVNFGMFLFLPSILAIILLVISIGLLTFRLLNITSQAKPPQLFYNNSSFNRAILDHCPLLAKSYLPTKIWGKNGHIQTIIYGKMGRIKSPFPLGDRHSVVLSDGATVTFDTFEPRTDDPFKGKGLLVVCPGIANSSESVYIRTYVDYAMDKGYKVAVLNHLGSMKTVPLTAPHIYTYGCTEEYSAMVKELEHLYPSTVKIAIGFSMGANIVMKYLGESTENQAKFIGAVSCCQGYDILEIIPYAMRWEHLRRMYVWAMARHQIGILRRHRHILFGPESRSLYGQFDENQILSATSLFDIDKYYSHRRAGFQCVEDYYKWSSSRFYINSVHIPVFLLNALDDPLVPSEIHYIPKQFSADRDNVIFAVTEHGGHLGFFEGGLIIPDTITWLDRVIIQYADALLSVNESANGVKLQNSI